MRLNDARIPAGDLEIAGRLTRLAVTESASALPGGGLLRSSPEFDLRIEAQAPATNGAGSAETRVRLEKRNRELKELIDSHNASLEISILEQSSSETDRDDESEACRLRSAALKK